MNIIFLAPASYPVRSSESIVNAKIAYILANLGHKITVYAVDSYDKIYPEAENDLLKHPNITVCHIHVPENKKGPLHSIYRRILWTWILLKTGTYFEGNNISYVFWKYIERNCDFTKFDVVISRGFWTEIAGISIAKKYKLPWIANWNDPYPLQMFPPPYGKGPNIKLSIFWKKILKDIQIYASYHTFPSERLRKYMLGYLCHIKDENTIVIPHIAHSMFFPKSNKIGAKLKMLHAGFVGAPRNPLPFLYALHELNSDCEYANSIECQFIGKVPSNFEAAIVELRLEKIVTVSPGKLYLEIIEAQKEYDIALIIEADCEEGIYLPTKVVDSIQGGLPLFCVSPLVGTQRDLINKYDIGYIANIKDIKSIKDNLKKAIDDFRNNRLPVVNKDICPYFFEETAAAKYTEIFSRLKKN